MTNNPRKQSVPQGPVETGFIPDMQERALVVRLERVRYARTKVHQAMPTPERIPEQKVKVVDQAAWMVQQQAHIEVANVNKPALTPNASAEKVAYEAREIIAQAHAGQSPQEVVDNTDRLTPEASITPIRPDIQALYDSIEAIHGEQGEAA